MTVSPFKHVPVAEAQADNPAFEHFRTSQLLAQAGKFAEACAAMQKAINLASVVTAVQNPLRPYLPHFWARKGSYYLGAGEYSKAIYTLQEAISSLELHTGSEFHEDAVYMHKMIGKAHSKLAKQIVHDHKQE